MSQYTYQFITSGLGDTALVRSDGAVIPQDESNSDYQRYLRWLENPDADEAQSL